MSHNIETERRKERANKVRMKCSYRYNFGSSRVDEMQKATMPHCCLCLLSSHLNAQQSLSHVIHAALAQRTLLFVTNSPMMPLTYAYYKTIQLRNKTVTKSYQRLQQSNCRRCVQTMLQLCYVVKWNQVFTFHQLNFKYQRSFKASKAYIPSTHKMKLHLRMRRAVQCSL